MTTAAITFFEACQAFLQERIELLKEARAKTRDISRWIAEIGHLNIASALSKIKQYQTQMPSLSEEQINGKIAKHFERAAVFLAEIHRNDAMTSTLIPSDIHNKQKSKSETLLNECQRLSAEYAKLAPDHISKVKSWLPLSFR